MNPVAITVIVLLLIYGVIALIMIRKIRNADAYYVMEGKAPTLFLVCGICMAYISGVTMIAGPGVGYSQGPLVLLASAQPGAWLGTVVAILFIGRKMKAIGCQTMPDYFVKRFSDNNVTFLAILIMCLGLELYGVSQLMSIGNVLSDVTGLSYEALIIIFTLALMLVCVPGGTWSVMMTDVFMFIVVFVGALVVCPIVLGHITGAALPALPAEFWEVGGLNKLPLSYTISQFFLWFMFFAASPIIITRVFPAKNDFSVFKACVISVALIAVISAVTYITGGMMRGIDPNLLQPDKVLLTAFLNYTPKIFALIGIATILTAAMSTAAIVFSLTGFALSRDLYGVINGGKPESGRPVKRARLAQLFVIGVGGVIAYFQPMSNFDISVFVCGIFASSWLPVIFLSLVWKRFSTDAAFYGMATGLLSLVLLYLMVNLRGVAMPFGINPYTLSIALSLLVSVVISLVMPTKSSSVVNYFRIRDSLPVDTVFTEARKTPDALEKLMRRYRWTRRIILLTVVITALVWLGGRILWGAMT